MAIKIISGGLKGSSSKNSDINQEPSSFMDLLKNVAAPATGLLSGFLGGIPQFTSTLISATKPLKKFLNDESLDLPISSLNYDLGEKALEYVQKGAEKLTPKKLQSYAQEATSGYLKPEGKISKNITKFARDVGSLAGTGAPAAVALGATAGSKGAKALGLGKVGEIAGGLIGGGLPGLWKQTSPSNLKKWSIDTYKKNYPIATKAADTLNLNASKLEDSLRDVAVKTFEQLEGKANLGQIRNNLKKIIQEIGPDGKANVLKMWDYKKNLSKLIGENIGPSNSVTQNFYKEALKPVNEFLASAGKAHPEFGKPFKLAEDLWKLRNIKGNVLQTIKDNKSLGDSLKNLPYAKAAMLGGAIWKFGTLPGVALAGAGKRGIDLFKIAKGNPSIQNRLLEIANEASLGNAKKLIGLSTKLEKEFKSEVEKAVLPSNVKVVSGGLK